MLSVLRIQLIALILLFGLASSQQLNACDTCPKYELLDYNPVANLKAVQKENRVRFTVLTDRLIRMEYDSNNKFEDRATLTFLNRNLPVPKYSVENKDGWMNITTAKLKLMYNYKSGWFTSSSLMIQGIGTDPLDFKGLWHYGDRELTNLMGTIRTLDGYIENTLNCSLIFQSGGELKKESQHCTWGLISKEGWHVVSDASNYVITQDDDWWGVKNSENVDDYFFGFGQNYKQALSEFTLVAGKIPVIPRYALGVWWTRWFAWDDYSLRQVIELQETNQLPLDVCVLDMNWHIKNAWGAYSFDKNLFPNYNESLAWLQNKQLKVAMNIHDDDGVQKYEDQFANMCKAMGVDPNTTQAIKFQICSSKTYAFSLEDIVLQPLEDLGVNFWWIDWQQDPTEGGCKDDSLNPTMILNKLRSTDSKRRAVKKGLTSNYNRNMILARFGGLGNHRYQVGFSGDVKDLSWGYLAFQPYFTATAANVGFGYWSHDLTGPGSNDELYIRWSQFVAYSGIIRFHERGMSSGGCAKSVFPDPAGGSSSAKCSNWIDYNLPFKHVDIMREILIERISLVPYIYTFVRKAYDTGLSLIRPLYYDYPTLQDAYTVLNSAGTYTQYMFGDCIMVAPIVSPISSSYSMVEKKIWIPEGNWFDQQSGKSIAGPAYITKNWTLSETPVFIQSGSIIPKRIIHENAMFGTAQHIFSELSFEIYPGLSQQSISLYEDDGATINYSQDQYSLITGAYSRNETNLQFTLKSNVVKQWYTGNIQRNITLKLINCFPPTSVTYQIQGQSAVNVPYQLFETQGTAYWNFNPDLYVEIVLPINVQIEKNQLTINVQGDFSKNDKLSGLKGAVRHAQLSKLNLDQQQKTPGTYDTSNNTLILAAGMGEKLAHYANPIYSGKQFLQLVEKYPELISEAYSAIKPLLLFDDRIRYSLELLYSTEFVAKR